MEWLCEDLILLAVDSGRGRVSGAYGIDYALMGAEMVRLADSGRIGIADGTIVVASAAPTGDAELDAALARISESPDPPSAADWVQRPRPRISGRYLERLTAAGVIRPETRPWRSTRWQITDPLRLTEARQRLDIIAESAGEVDLSQAAYAGLTCAIGLDRQLYRGRGRRAERSRLREVAAGRWTAMPGAAGAESESVDTGEAVRRTVAETNAIRTRPDDGIYDAASKASQSASNAAAIAAIHAATHSAVHAATHAVAHAVTSAAHGATGGGGHGVGGHGGH